MTNSENAAQSTSSYDASLEAHQASELELATSDEREEMVASYPSSELLARLLPSTVAQMYVDVVEQYEWIKSEDCKSAAAAVMGGPLKALEWACGLHGFTYTEIETIGYNQARVVVSGKVREANDKWFRQHRGWDR